MQMHLEINPSNLLTLLLNKHAKEGTARSQQVQEGLLLNKCALGSLPQAIWLYERLGKIRPPLIEDPDVDVQEDLRLCLREVILPRPLEACTTEAVFCKDI